MEATEGYMGADSGQGAPSLRPLFTMAQWGRMYATDEEAEAQRAGMKA